MPAGSTFFKAKMFCFSSNPYLFRLPFGVSTTTCRLRFFLLNGDSRDATLPCPDFAFLDKFNPICRFLLETLAETIAVFHGGLDCAHQVQNSVLGHGGVNTGSARDGQDFFHVAQRKKNQRHTRIEI